MNKCILNFAELETATIANDYECVLIDYFDTIVKRDVNPEDVKKLWAEEVSKIFPNTVVGKDLYRKRFDTEALLCKRNEQNGLDLEFSALECYEMLWSEFFANTTLIDKERFISICLDTEIAIECKVQKVDSNAIDFLKNISVLGKKIYLVSDFYLPSSAFDIMLDHHDIRGLFSSLFISSDFILTKRSGRLYQHVQDALKIKHTKCIMIGDNMVSDIQKSAESNLDSIHINRHDQYSLYKVHEEKNSDAMSVYQDIRNLLSSASDTPFSGMALTLYLFIDKLHSKLVSAGYKDVFFLAREGQFLKYLFDEFQSKKCLRGEVFIKTHYLEVSRRATFLASLNVLENETFDMLFRQYRRISANEFLLNLGIEKIIADLINLIPGYDFTCREDDFPSSEIYHKIVTNSRFKIAYESARVSSRHAFRKYLDHFAQVNPSRMCVVDVGWKGTIQDNLSRLFKISSLEDNRHPVEIDGFYLGIVAHGAASADNRKEGLLFSIDDNKSSNYAVFCENRSLFEVILAADHGSAARYDINEVGEGFVIRSDFEEKDLFESKVRPLQIILSKIFLEIVALLSIYNCSSAKLNELAVKNHGSMVFNPTVEEMDWFASVYHVENFGVFETSDFVVKKKNLEIYQDLKLLIRILFARNTVNFGFWPWLYCRLNGGIISAFFYRLYRTKSI